MVNEWLQKNMWSLIIGALTLTSTFTLYGYRIGALEEQMKVQSIAITALNANSVTTQVTLAKISTDIEYIKINLGKLVH